MDLSSLEIFCAVAEEGSITRAALRLNRVQSNVTTRVQQLEEQLKVGLFQREGKGMVLTAEGSQFIQYARRLLSLAQEATQSLNTGQPVGRLKIGTMEATAASRLPGPLSIFHSQWPEVALDISTGTTDKLLEDVIQHRVDCAFVALPSGKDPSSVSDILTGIAIWSEQLVLLEPKVKVHGKEHNLVAFEQGCTYRTVGENWFRKAVPKGVHINEANSYHAIMASVAAGVCSAVMPQSVLDLYNYSEPKFLITPLQAVDTWLVWREQYKSAALDAFRQVCANPGK